MTIAIVAKQRYIFRVLGNKVPIERVGLSPGRFTDLDGTIVTIKSVAYSGSKQQVRVEGPASVSGYSYYWPPECFQPIEFEFIIGGEYICDYKPEKVADELWYGWNETMTKNCGKVLTCEEIVDEYRGARLRSPDGYCYKYTKKWVRPVSYIKQIKTVERNVFNFWPGATTK